MSVNEYDQVLKLVKQGKDYELILEQIEQKAKDLRESLHNKLVKHLNIINKSNFDAKALDAFEQKYWTIVKIPEMENEYILVVPKMYDVNFGHLIYEDEAWRHFRVNQITNWISDIPDEIKKELNFKEPIDVQIIGNYLVGKDLDKVKEMYPAYVKKEGNRLLIKPTTQFDLICKLLKNGTMPYRYDPIPENVLHHRDVTFELRDYQKEIIKSFKDHRHATVIIPTSAGKTFVGMKAMSEVKPPYLIFVPTRTLVEQWKARIETYTNIPLDEVEIMTYQAGLKKEFTKKYGLVIFDENHRTPADETWKLTQIPRECTLGMTATPFREDGREYLIVALSGYPFKLSWKHAKELGILKLPKCHVWVVKNADQKFGIMEKLLKKNVKTIIFCDDLNLGEKLSSKYGYPFVQGKTENRLEIIKKNLFTFASRVLDEGLSEVDIRQIIEVDWLGKSKRQSLQRVGRLTHGKDEDGKPVEGTHNIIMTLDEYIEDKQRIVVLADNGFETFYHIDDDPEMMEKIEKAEEKGYRKPRQHKEQKVRQPKPKVEPAPEVDLVHYPMLKHKGARNVYDKMAKGEREMFLFFIDPPNMDKKFTTNQLQFNLGYADPSGVWYAVQKLIKKKVVKKVGNTYMQCISELI